VNIRDVPASLTKGRRAFLLRVKEMCVVRGMSPFIMKVDVSPFITKVGESPFITKLLRLPFYLPL
jgi:hypothetical protein